jgi:hypothetical protein
MEEYPQDGRLMPLFSLGKKGLTVLFDDEDIRVVGDSIDSCHVMWDGTRWDVYESSFKTVG